MAEWSACQPCNPAVLGLRPILTTICICFTAALSSNPQPHLSITKWFASGQLGFLKMLCWGPLVYQFISTVKCYLQKSSEFELGHRLDTPMSAGN